MPSNSLARATRLLLAGAVVSLLSACGTGGPKGDPVHGKELYTQCQGCHKLTENYTGPMHCGLFGRPAATVPDFDYSEAMKASGIVWNEKTIDEFLVSPIAYVTGTKMGFAGFTSATDRADVIAYLKQVNEDPSTCPQ